MANLTEAQVGAIAREVILEIGFQRGEGPVRQGDDGPGGGSALDTDTFFVLFSGYLVFFMQCGFCMLCAGSVRAKNSRNIILKTLLDTCFGALGWYLLGYGLAFGSRSNDFLGISNFALHDVSASRYHTWLFQYAFAATATTVVSGAVAERTKFGAYMLYAVFLTAWVYPVIVHWVWAPGGWFTAHKAYKSGLFNGTGLIDFSGSGVVHMTGGISGLIGAWIVGPRIGRFDTTGRAREIPGQSASLALLGVFILWFAWYGFNPGSALSIAGHSEAAALSAINTTLSGATGCITTLLISMAISHRITGTLVWDVVGAGNGALAGLVSITGACALVQPWAACVIGIAGGCMYALASNLLLNWLKIDDPLDAFSVHGVCGVWGLIAAALFADKSLINTSYPAVLNDDNSIGSREFGLFVGGNGQLLASATAGIMVISIWIALHMLPAFWLMKKLRMLRVDTFEEIEGLDLVHRKDPVFHMECKKSPCDSIFSGDRSAHTAKDSEGSHHQKMVEDIVSDMEVMKGQIHRVFEMQQLGSRDLSSRDAMPRSVRWSNSHTPRGG